MEITMIIGAIWGITALILGVIIAKSSLLLFFDLPSIMITVGGSIASMLVAYPLKNLLKIPVLFRIAIFPIKYNLNELIVTIVSFSEKARREGLLALEDDLEELVDPFMRKGLQLVVDGTDPELVKNITGMECSRPIWNCRASRRTGRRDRGC